MCILLLTLRLTSLLAHCSGLDIPTARKELAKLPQPHYITRTRAFKDGKVYMVDGNHMFNRSGPRLVDALEFLAGVIHGRPDLIPEGFPYEML